MKESGGGCDPPCVLMLLVKRLQPEDVPAVLRIQADAYRETPQLLESAESFLSKMRLFRAGSIGCFADGELAGYVFCHPWHAADVVPLDSVIQALPADADCLYVHDLSVLAAYRGQGIADRLFHDVLALGDALGLLKYALVAVQRSESFWGRYGFHRTRSFQYACGVPASGMRLERLAQ